MFIVSGSESPNGGLDVTTPVTHSASYLHILCTTREAANPETAGGKRESTADNPGRMGAPGRGSTEVA